MPAAIEEKRTAIAPSIRALLDALRARIRQYVWAEGVAGGGAWLGFAFWLSLAIDWFFEPPVPIRVLVLLSTAGVLLWIVVKLIARRAFVPLTDANMATVLERRFPQLDDSLLTAVILARRDPAHDGYNPEMLDLTCGEAVRRIKSVRLGEVFNVVPLRRAVLAAALLSISILFFAVAAPRALGTWSRRTLGLSNELWPRQCKLELPEGFVSGVRKVARGSDVEIIVRAVPVAPGKFVIPREVEIRYRDEGGTRGRATMDKIGRADPEKDPYQEFAYTRRNVLSPIRFDVQGGDASLKNLRIEVVESPNIERWTLDCEYPAYLGRAKRGLRVTGAMPLPQGTRIIVHAKANKPLDRVRIDRESGEGKTARPTVLDAAQLSADRREFDYSLDALAEDATLSVTLFDTDGIKSREPIRLALTALPDQPPQIAAQLDGIGSAVTPKARIAVAGRATDDYGIGKLWFEHGLEQQPPAVSLVGQSAEKPADAPAERNLEGQALEIEPLGLKPGQKFQVSLKAADLCALGSGPNVGSGEQWLLDVVTPEQLRAILDSRELVLRQRFESIVREMTETRDVLARAKRDGLSALDSTSDSKPGKMTKDGESKAGDKPVSGDEPGDVPSRGGKSDAPEQRLAMLLFRVQGAATNCLKSTQETLGLAEAFEDIRKQLVNNRVDTEELKQRLQSGIADPLRNIAGEMLPELERRLELLQAGLEKSQFDPRSCDDAKAQADAVLLAMQKVLDRMIELEDYNQLVEMLREVIKMQEQLRNQTEQRQKQKIRDLLKE
ncbi:MAG: hypothetical protein IT426_09230 [Pirellulales bacterium]|nr:hypothetical protein [Pirellulales bacterium]